MKQLLPFVFLPWLASGQAPSVQAEWDIAQTVQALAEGSARLGPLVEQLSPPEWVSRGASETFVAQWETAKRELAALNNSTQVLAKQPEKLTAAFETYFRMQLIDSQLRTLSEGVRKYQNPAVADLLIAALADTAAHRDRLQQHITDLAGQKEQEFSVIDREAQRCREMLIRQPAPTSAKRPAAAKP